MKRRGVTLLEALTGVALATVFVVSTAPLFLQELTTLRVAQEELLAREAILEAKGRLLVGRLPLPTAARPRLGLKTGSPRIELQLEKVEREEVDPRLVKAGGLAVVRLRASWVGGDGRREDRTLTVLVPDREGR